MMPYESVDREAVWAALFAWLEAKVGANFVTIGRRHVPPPDLTPIMQPALFMVQVKETHKPKPRGVPTQLMLHGFLILYAPAPVANQLPGAETVLAATTLNNLFKAIDDALQPDTMDGYFSLGGMVSHCWIEGDTDMDPGIFGPQAAAILPLHILVP
jgi:hypothetical protein